MPRAAVTRCRKLFPIDRVPSRGTLCLRAGHPAKHIAGRIVMRNLLLATCLGAVASVIAGAASANDELMKLSQNPNDWAMPTGNYTNQRFSQLKQVTAANVNKLQV